MHYISSTGLEIIQARGQKKNKIAARHTDTECHGLARDALQRSKCSKPGKRTYNDTPFDPHLDVVIQPYDDFCSLYACVSVKGEGIAF